MPWTSGEMNSIVSGVWPVTKYRCDDMCFSISQDRARQSEPYFLSTYGTHAPWLRSAAYYEYSWYWHGLKAGPNLINAFKITYMCHIITIWAAIPQSSMQSLVLAIYDIFFQECNAECIALRLPRWNRSKGLVSWEMAEENSSRKYMGVDRGGSWE